MVCAASNGRDPDSRRIFARLIIASCRGVPKVTEKAKKKISKYDVDRIGQGGTGKGVNVYSLEEERDLGRQLSEQLEMMTKLITDQVIRRYLDRLG